MDTDAMLSLLYGGCAVVVVGALVCGLHWIRIKIFRYLKKSAGGKRTGAGKE